MLYTLLDVGQMQINAFEARDWTTEAQEAREIRAELRHLKRNPGMPEFGRRVRRLRRRQRELQQLLPRTVVGTTFNPYRTEPVTASTAA